MGLTAPGYGSARPARRATSGVRLGASVEQTNGTPPFKKYQDKTLRSLVVPLQVADFHVALMLLPVAEGRCVDAAVTSIGAVEHQPLCAQDTPWRCCTAYPFTVLGIDSATNALVLYDSLPEWGVADFQVRCKSSESQSRKALRAKVSKGEDAKLVLLEAGEGAAGPVSNMLHASTRASSIASIRSGDQQPRLPLSHTWHQLVASRH